MTTQTLTIAPTGERAAVPVVTSSEAKAKFADLLEAVRAGGVRVISRHEKPEAVLVSLELFEALTKAIPDPLESLRADFEAQVARMQTPEHRRAVDSLFGASPSELGAAAVAAAKVRG